MSVTDFLLRLPWLRPREERRSARVGHLYETHGSAIYRYLRGMGFDSATAEDATHDVFMIAHRRWREFEAQHAGAERAWLFAIASRIAKEYRRAGRREPVGALDDVALSDTRPNHADECPEARLARRRRVRRLQDALDHLSDEQREVFVLAEIEERTAPEISAITGVSVNTVYSRLRLARARIKQLLGATDEG